MALHSGNKKGRSRSKAPNWGPSYLSDRWIVHRPFTVSHASQHIPCGILYLRLQTVSSLSNYSWNQLFFRNPWSKMTVAWYFIHRNVQSTFTFLKAQYPLTETQSPIFDRKLTVSCYSLEITGGKKQVSRWWEDWYLFVSEGIHGRIFRGTLSSLMWWFWNSERGCFPQKAISPLICSASSSPFFSLLPS